MNDWRIRQKKRIENNKNNNHNNSSFTSNTSNTSKINEIKEEKNYYKRKEGIQIMNKDIIYLISEFIPYNNYNNNSNKLISSSSITINKLGEVYFLCEDGEIRYLTNNNNNNNNNENTNENNELNLTQKLELFNVTNDEFNEMEFSHIEFNYSSTMLLVAGSQSIGIVPFYNHNHNSNNNNNNNNQLYLEENENKHELKLLLECHPNDAILKVQWHPLSDTHLVILLQSQVLKIIDTYSHQITDIPLNANSDYISFCFGPCVDWMRLCVFLIDSRGNISYICPVLPCGAILSSSSIFELKQWLQQERLKNEELNQGSTHKSRELYLENIDLYLRAAFSTYNDPITSSSSNTYLDESFIQDDYNQQTIHRAGIPRNSTQHTPGTIYYKSFNQIPQHQGPLQVENRIIRPSKSTNRNINESIACDICVPIARGYNTIPLLLVVWSDGSIEELLISGSISPNWRNNRIELTKELDNDLNKFNATLVHMETISLNVSENLKESSKQALVVPVSPDEYYLVPDPILGHSFHLVGVTTGVTYLLYLSWLETEFNPNNTTSQYDSPQLNFRSSILFDDDNHNDNDEQGTKNSSKTSTVLITCDGKKNSTISGSASTSSLTSLEQESTRGISGLFICPNPTQGHIALIRYTDGFLAAINVTIQRKLLQLEGRIKNRNNESENVLRSITQDNLLEHKEYSLQWISQKLVKKALVGLETVPKMGGNQKVSTSECLESLLLARQHLDSNVVLPLEQLFQRIKFSEQIIRDVYEGQVNLLNGEENNNNNSNNKSNNNNNNNDNSSIGLIKKIELIEKRQNELKKKIEKISEKLIQQKNLAASALSASYVTKSKVTHAEKIYYSQLQTWEDLAQRYEQILNNLTISKQYLGTQSNHRGKHLTLQASTKNNQFHNNNGNNMLNGDIPFYLSPKEEDICENLLGSQGEALKISNDAILELEQKLSLFM